MDNTINPTWEQTSDNDIEELLYLFFVILKQWKPIPEQWERYSKTDHLKTKSVLDVKIITNLDI